MDLAQLITEYRIQADDQSTPPRTTDETLAIYASDAEKEACERSNLLFDDSDTDNLTVFAIGADQGVVSLSMLTRRIDSAQFTSSVGGRAVNLRITGIDEIGDRADWRTESCSRPSLIAQVRQNEARLFPIPHTAGTLRLSMYRLPLYAMEDENDEPEIHEQHHIGLVDWMLYRTFISKDGENEDPARANAALDRFTERFGKRPNASTFRKQYERRRITTRPI